MRRFFCCVCEQAAKVNLPSALMFSVYANGVTFSNKLKILTWVSKMGLYIHMYTSKLLSMIFHNSYIDAYPPVNVKYKQLKINLY